MCKLVLDNHLGKSYQASHNGILYYIDKSVFVENRPLVKFIQNYIRDSSSVFSSSITSFPTFTLLFAQTYVLLSIL